MRVNDPLWMFARQWQTGELDRERGEYQCDPPRIRARGVFDPTVCYRSRRFSDS